MVTFNNMFKILKYLAIFEHAVYNGDICRAAATITTLPTVSRVGGVPPCPWCRGVGGAVGGAGAPPAEPRAADTTERLSADLSGQLFVPGSTPCIRLHPVQDKMIKYSKIK